MTDLDVLARSAAPGWRPVVRCLRDHAPARIAGPIIASVLTKHLREHGGLACVADQRAFDEGSAPNIEDLVPRLRRLVRSLAADRVLPQLVGSTYRDMDHADQQMSEYLGAAALPDVAERLLRFPAGGRGLRAPSRPGAALSHLLAEPAPLGAGAR